MVQTPSALTPPLLTIRGLHKQFAAPVLVDFDWEVRSGEVHALVGSNGAGKSTLARILCGLLPADRGDIMLENRPYAPDSRKEAEAQGVQIVMQELNLIDTLSVAENLHLNHLPGNWGILSFHDLVRESRKILCQVGLEDLDPMIPVGRLGIGHQQLIEIAAALIRPCRLLILDEPTAALTDPQIHVLFDRIQLLRAKGTSVIYISHRMEEIRHIADRVTVLRDGRKIATHCAPDVSLKTMFREMAGQDQMESKSHQGEPTSKVALSVRNLTRGGTVQNISFEVHECEILGLAGLIGSGRTETLRLIYGADRRDTGEIHVPSGQMTRDIRSPADAVKAGIGMIPEDRKRDGLLLPMNVRANTSLASMNLCSGKSGWIDRSREQELTAAMAQSLDLQCHSLDQAMSELSGGNQQKTIMARWLMRNCRILLCDEPTRGIDMAAKQSIYGLLQKLAQNGKAIIVASSELEELLLLCDRIAVLSAGCLVKTFRRGEWTREAITEEAFKGHVAPLLVAGENQGQKKGFFKT